MVYIGLSIVGSLWLFTQIIIEYLDWFNLEEDD